MASYDAVSPLDGIAALMAVEPAQRPVIGATQLGRDHHSPAAAAPNGRDR